MSLEEIYPEANSYFKCAGCGVLTSATPEALADLVTLVCGGPSSSSCPNLGDPLTSMTREDFLVEAGV